VAEILGVDGDWVPRAQLLIPPGRFLAADLAAPEAVSLAGRIALPAGLAMSLEVAEHLPPAAAPGFVALLCGLSDAVIFSAAIPYQGGHLHVTEQWPDHWAGLFAAQGFRCFDLLRPRLWSDPDCDWWYAQNILLFARAGSAAEAALLQHGPPVAAPARLVHPAVWLGLAAQLVQPPRAAEPIPLRLPFDQAAAPAPAGPLPLPGGGTVTVVHGNPWTFGRADGVQLHANAPDTPPVRLDYRGLPPAADGLRMFRATLVTAPESPVLVFRVALLAADGCELASHRMRLEPATRWEVRHDFPAAPEATGLRLELDLAAGAPNHFHAALQAVAARLE
jgi:hypothetical protein